MALDFDALVCGQRRGFCFGGDRDDPGNVNLAGHRLVLRDDHTHRCKRVLCTVVAVENKAVGAVENKAVGAVGAQDL